jgi:hypothetical protein
MAIQCLAPILFFVILISTINKTSFLKIVDANEIKRILRIISERKEDLKVLSKYKSITC